MTADQRRGERTRLYLQPAVGLALAAGILWWAFSRQLSATQRASMPWHGKARNFRGSARLA